MKILVDWLIGHCYHPDRCQRKEYHILRGDEMSEHLKKAIEELEGKLQQQMDEVAETKKAINVLCRQLSLPARYADVKADSAKGILAIRRDHFFQKPLATAVRDFLKLKDSAASLDEIYAALKQGGFEFVGKDEAIEKRGLQISLAKNRNMFAYLKSTNTFGLWEKYGGRPLKDQRADREERVEKDEEENAPAGQESKKLLTHHKKEG
jgi:hypothetical protein